jgi:flagellum-specific peptidoglycan hydrolase FlgJ
MKVIPKLQQGNTIESDNTKVVRPEIHEPIKAKPRQYSIVDLGGEPSNDTRSAAERNRDYWHPIKGARDRFKASMSNETNPLVGIERTILPSAAGAALVTTPAAVVVGALGNMTVDKLTGGWGNWLEDKTGIPSEIGVYTNPGAWYGGAKGYKIGKDKLITKSIKGDADLAWNPINKNHWIFNKEAESVMRMGDKEFMTFRQPGTDYIGPIDDVAGHLVKFQMSKGKLRQTSQDMWKFNPADYAKRWNNSPNTANQVRLIKQAALMDKVGRPFILQQSNPIWIEGKSVRNPELVTMAHGGRFDFKKSPLLKKQEEINGKRDMRKKFIKSSRPTYKKRIKKAQQGMRFVSYNPVSNPTIDYTDITNPINPFSEYNFNTVYDKPEALVVPVRDTNEPDVVANNPIAEPVINKSVASKPVTDKPVTVNSTWKSPYTNRRQWTTELINAYKKAGITNDNAIRMLLAQDALESSWGKSAQGKYNFGNLTTGSSWKGDYVTGNDKNAKGEAIKQKFRSYNSMDEYAADKIQFLKRLYDFDENDDINKFVAKLTGSNKGKRRYAEAKEYANSLRGVYNSFKAGGIIKYQEPAQPIKYMGGYDKRGNIVLPVNNENGMNNVTLPEVTVTPRNINLAGAVDRGRREAAPYVSTLLTGAIFGPLSVAGGYAGNEAVNKITNVASNDKYKDWADILSKTTGMNPVVADFFNIGNLAGGFGMRNFGPKLNLTGDAYTTIGGKFGYYGNPVQRVWHTVGRNKNWKTSAKHPELMRKLEEPIKVNSNGTLQVTNPNPRFSETITNFTTDRPVVSHAGGNWNGRDLYIFNPKIVKGKKPASIEPSDTFYPKVNITAKPSQTTLVSGNPLRLADAKSKGMSTLSSPEARRLYQEAQWKYLGDLKKWKSNKDTGGNFKIKFDDYADDYAKEIQRLQSKRGTPTVYDYAKLERSTGLDAGVIGIDEMNPQIVDYYMNAGAEVPYPNGRVIDYDYFYPQINSEKNVLNRTPYNKVFYDPTTTAEWDYKELHGIK